MKKTRRRILIDAGPLCAIANPREVRHSDCAEAVQTLPLPLITTWPCFTEAMYLAGSEKRGGTLTSQKRLHSLLEKGAVAFYELTPKDLQEMMTLIERYRVTASNRESMDFADASLVAAAGSLGINEVFTFDPGFIYFQSERVDFFSLIP